MSLVCAPSSSNRVEAPDWYWVEYIKRRVREKNLGFVGMFTARPGKGKSWSCLSLASLVDHTFVNDINTNGAQSRIASSLAQFGRMIANEKKPGRVYILEEGGVNANSKDAMTKESKAYMDIMQVARYKRLILFINAPYTSLYVKVGRNLLDGEFRVVSRWHDWNVIRPTLVDYKDKVDKTFYQFLRLLTGMRDQKINQLWLPKPPQVLIDKYSEYERAIKDAIIEEAVQTMEAAEGLTKPKESRPIWYCSSCNKFWMPRKDNPVKCMCGSSKIVRTNPSPQVIKEFSKTAPL